MTKRFNIQTVSIREFIWFVPFLCIALMALGLFRQLPHLPAPAHSRIVVDAMGTPVQIALPFRGTVLTFGAHASQYLAATRSPETLLIAGGKGYIATREWFAKCEMSWVYPQVLKEDRFWDLSGRFRGHGPYVELEKAFAFNPGVYLGSMGGPMLVMRRIGLPALYTTIGQSKDWNQDPISETRVMSEVAGQSEWGKTLIAHFWQAYEDLERDLKPASITHKLSVLSVESSGNNRAYLRVGAGHDLVVKPRAGLRDASEGYYALGKVTDAERVLATDPDIIIAWGVRPQDFMNDPRWRGFKAVQERRVYRPPVWWPNPEGILFRPLNVRWLAEVAYPERLQPKVRRLFRDIFMRDFGSRVSDDQIDKELRLDQNKNQPGFERFTKDYKQTINRRQHDD